MSIETLIQALEGRRSGSAWMARCPAHDDHNPSLSIRETNGKILVHCHAGCSQNIVLEVLRERGLWQSARAEEPRVVAAYDYKDQSGALLYQVVRYEPKDFKQRRPDGRGGWVWKKHPRQVLYRLPELLEAPIVFVVEGEKDAETLRDYGFVATTNAGGANAAWLECYTTTLAGREVIIVPDNDQPGWQRAKIIARALLGSAARIRVFDLPAEVKDVSDWFAAGHSECELIAMLEGVHAV
jgi:putative DNA primase/helicase